MLLRISVGPWRATLLAAVGLAGCAGAVASNETADSGSGGGSGTGGAPGFQCTGGQPVALPGGFVRCGNGFVHRPSTSDCPSSLDTWNPVFTGHDGGAQYVECITNADCQDGPNGYCVPTTGFAIGGMPGVNISRCEYGCIRDADCAQVEVCRCGDPIGQCVTATCTVDADCPDGACIELSHLETTGCGYGPTYSLGCWRADMTCATAADCSGGNAACNEGLCANVPVCGRPFLVLGASCRAEAEGRSDWVLCAPPDGLVTLDRSTREALAAHWTEMGLMEHASVAAFARFAFDLMALGAPADLLEATQEALGDEIRHARLCFGLASAYGERSIGPGPLAVRHALAEQTPAAIVSTAFLEACVGETCAAIEAAEAASRATDPRVAAVLHQIAADETRHAELGFRFVKWALDALGPEVRAAVEQAMTRAATRGEPLHGRKGREAPERDLMAGHGLLPVALRVAVREAALREVVLPCARALLHGDQASAA